jgi:predicted glutamine amidotransferase
MCELLGINFNSAVRPIFSFPGLMEGSWYNRDGWGLAYYPHNSKTAQVFKEPAIGITSELVAFLQNYEGLWANLFIGHVRKASKGGSHHHNSHPFTRYFGSREWVFCHHGTLPIRKTVSRQTYVPIGDSDSEEVFCDLLNSMKRAKVKSATRKRYTGFSEQDFDYIYKALVHINGTEGSFNCIFSDGIFLFCYRDKHGQRELHYVQRKYPFHTTILRDNDFEVDLEVMKGNDDRGYTDRWQ